MAPFPWSDVVVIAALILLNGLFSMSELAIVSARTAQLRVAAERGSAAARTALALAADPGKFLSTVQIGITLVGIIAGAYSGASLGGPVGERLAGLGVPADFADDSGFALVIVLTTYFSLVIGELVPKQLALRAAVPVALIMARPMAILARVAAPFVWALDRSSAMLMRLFGTPPKGQGQLTAEELQMIFAEATHSGVIEEGERAVLSGVMKLVDRPVRELMTPRTEIDWIEQSADAQEVLRRIAQSPHSVLPVAEGSTDRIVGVVKVREVLAGLIEGSPPELSELLREPAIVPDRIDAMDALRILQQADVAMAMVHDEYGHLEGIVTPTDLLTAIVGQFAGHQDEGDEPMVVERADGSLLISGAMLADEMSERLGLTLSEDREYATAAGFVLSVLKKLPHEGEAFDEGGWRFEVIDMDGRRIDKLLVQRLEVPEEAESED
ncbi:DNA-binding protein [Croceicoccus estronivorus]|uniref:hemolysin family protein n=1 Tax=Croceicoccus estronivorus TaxID=1172626 RepID=UPI0008368B89|nr:hemolysin family protein [Croceicoccus estronivorus]OCC24048.1 DNA-binding protein [Croceicoccus estronivorus]